MTVSTSLMKAAGVLGSSWHGERAAGAEVISEQEEVIPTGNRIVALAYAKSLCVAVPKLRLAEKIRSENR
jgi:hypothetical protein